MVHSHRVTIEHVKAQLIALGVQRDGVLLVHTAFSKVGPIDGGPGGLIEALRHANGPGGTLVMPSMSDDDDHPFDAEKTPSMGMGIVADTFWRLSDVLRSDSPHAFAAVGRHAAFITSAHPWDVPHGQNSPVGRVEELDGQVLLLGVGHDANTTIHLAETTFGVRYRLAKSLTVVQHGRITRQAYGEIDHCCENFVLVDRWLESAGKQRCGPVGHADARLIRSRDVVRVVLDHLRENETVFLHAPGVDAECDEARASLREH